MHGESRLGKVEMNILQRPWYASLLVFVIWHIILITGAFLQFKGNHLSLDQMIKNYIVFGTLAAAVFLPGAVTYLKWWPEVGWKGPAIYRICVYYCYRPFCFSSCWFLFHSQVCRQLSL